MSKEVTAIYVGDLHEVSMMIKVVQKSIERY